MKTILWEIAKRLKSTATVLGIVGYVVTILVTLNVNVNGEAITAIATAVCGICVLLGIMNKDGMNTTKWNR